MDDMTVDSAWIPTVTTSNLLIDYGWSPSCEIFSPQIKCLICDADSDNIICSRCAALLKQIVKDKLLSEIVGD